MVTNVTMQSQESRELYGVTIRQETKDSFLSLTDLQEAYTQARVKNGWSDKDISNILNREENIERIYYLLQEQKLLPDKTTNSWFYEEVKKNSLTKVLKSLGVYRTTGRGSTKQTMCNVYIWVLVALELNPELYAKVIMWVTDKLILNRIEAGDFYKSLSSALYTIPSPDYKAIAIQLNIKVFGKHEDGIRNKGSTKQLEDLKILEANIAYGITNGWFKTNEDVINAIKNWKRIA